MRPRDAMQIGQNIRLEETQILPQFNVWKFFDAPLAGVLVDPTLRHFEEGGKFADCQQIMDLGSRQWTPVSRVRIGQVVAHGRGALRSDIRAEQAQSALLTRCRARGSSVWSRRMRSALHPFIYGWELDVGVSSNGLEIREKRESRE